MRARKYEKIIMSLNEFLKELKLSESEQEEQKYELENEVAVLRCDMAAMSVRFSNIKDFLK